MKDIGASVSDEMGAPLPMAEKLQAGAGLGHIIATLDVLKNYHFEETVGSAVVVREPVGVIGMITPWNWPLNQIACKVAPAIAAGCTMILKPSEFTPTSALIFAEILHEAGVPKGVFNLINGLGPEVGAAMSEHPNIDMISFTGSTRAGIDVAKRAAPTVKRVSQELGGKSPNVILEGADLTKAVTGGVMHMFNNSGQSCNAPSRMIVPLSKMKEVAAIAKGVADKTKAGDPRAEGTTIGPVVNRGQWDKIQGLIQKGIEEGATLVAGGPGLPEGVNKGFYVRPTIFADVTENMTIAREEIFGPVLVVMGAKDEEDAVGSPTTRRTVWRVTSPPTPSRPPARSAAGSAPATSTCRACPTTAPRRSAATSSPATAANGANTASRSSSRSKRSPASTPRKFCDDGSAGAGYQSRSGVLHFRGGAATCAPPVVWGRRRRRRVRSAPGFRVCGRCAHQIRRRRRRRAAHGSHRDRRRASSGPTAGHAPCPLRYPCPAAARFRRLDRRSGRTSAGPIPDGTVQRHVEPEPRAVERGRPFRIGGRDHDMVQRGDRRRRGGNRERPRLCQFQEKQPHPAGGSGLRRVRFHERVAPNPRGFRS